MRADDDIKRDVEEALHADPVIDATDIVVLVKSGAVTLSGFVRAYNQKWEAEEATKKVPGVIGVANDIEVRLPLIHRRPDPEIARDCVEWIQYRLPGAAAGIKVTVRDGRVTLEGEVEFDFQRTRAEAAIRKVRGVRAIRNLIEVKPHTVPAEAASQED
jgi:osmotically-inducible protein OsmY